MSRSPDSTEGSTKPNFWNLFTPTPEFNNSARDMVWEKRGDFYIYYMDGEAFAADASTVEKYWKGRAEIEERFGAALMRPFTSS